MTQFLFIKGKLSVPYIILQILIDISEDICYYLYYSKFSSVKTKNDRGKETHMINKGKVAIIGSGICRFYRLYTNDGWSCV